MADELIFEWPSDYDESDYKWVDEGETVELENPLRLPNDLNPLVTTVDRLERGTEGEVIEFDESDYPRKALVRFTVEEDAATTLVDLWVALEDLDLEVNYTWVAVDEAEDYANVCDWLTEEMESTWGDGPYRVYIGGYHLTWDGLSGHKNVTVDDGRDLIQACLPDTNDYSLRVYRFQLDAEPGFKIVVGHHDGTSVCYCLRRRLASGVRQAAETYLRLRYEGQLEFSDEDLLDELDSGYSPTEAIDSLAGPYGWRERSEPRFSLGQKVQFRDGTLRDYELTVTEIHHDGAYIVLEGQGVHLGITVDRLEAQR